MGALDAFAQAGLNQSSPDGFPILLGEYKSPFPEPATNELQLARDLGPAGLVLGGLVVGKVAAVGKPPTMFHYTTAEGMEGIVSSARLNPSLRRLNPRDVRYGEGQYLSDIQPGTMTCAQLSRCFLGQPFQGRRFTNYVEIDVSGLNVVQGRPGVFVVPNGAPLDLTGRIVGYGVNSP